MAVALAASAASSRAGTPTLAQRLLRPLGEWLVYGPIKDQLGLTRLRHAFTGGEAIGEDTFVFYRALGVEAAPALRPDREQRLQRDAGRRRGAAAHRRPAAAGRGRAHQRQRRDPGPLGQRVRRLLRTTRRRRARRSRTAGCTPATPATSSPTATSWCWGGCPRWCTPRKGERYIPNYIENRLKFSPYIKDVAVLGQGPRHAGGDRLHRPRAGGPLGRAARHLLHVLCRPVAEARGHRAGGQARARASTPRCPSALKLRHFVSLHKEFDADDGEITRTRKLRRNVVEERYAPIIDAIYGGQKTA